MISEIANSLFLTYLASEYLSAGGEGGSGGRDSGVAKEWRRRKRTHVAVVGALALAANVLDRLFRAAAGVGTHHGSWWDLMGVSASVLAPLDLPLRVVVAAASYVAALYVDTNRRYLFRLRRRRRKPPGPTSSPTQQPSSPAEADSGHHNHHYPIHDDGDDGRNPLPFVSAFLPKVGHAFIRVLPAYPFMAVAISFCFMFVISLWEALHLPLEWLNGPIYYGTLYGPFAWIYIHVKTRVRQEASALPT